MFLPPLLFAYFKTLFVIYRSESATDDRQRIIIPFFTLFVKDLYIAKESLDFSVTSSEGPRAFDLEKASRYISGGCNIRRKN